MTLWTRLKYKLFKIYPVADFEARRELMGEKGFKKANLELYMKQKEFENSIGMDFQTPEEKPFEEFMAKFIGLIEEYNVTFAQRFYATDPPHSPPQIIILQDQKSDGTTVHSCLKLGTGFDAEILKMQFTYHLGGTK